MLHVENLNIKVGDFELNDIGFRLSEGAYYFLLGESGSGKTLLLETIAGIRKIRSGSIVIAGRNVTRKSLSERGVGLVFQKHALFPHMRVFDNIAFALRRQSLDRKRITAAVEEIAERLSVDKLLLRYPDGLSGGELQRVALARTLVMKPKVLLLDEPLSSLDLLLKEELIEVLRTIHKQGQTMLHVTHDYYEVAQLAEKISIIEKGRIIQSGTKKQIQDFPANRLAERLTFF